ncbi:MAG: hypothetical protein H7X95_01805, partial [Deltaproteobacteria bacterium]|nr:hypothetical protein [Deltaproteobacteria bacterium]
MRQLPSVHRAPGFLCAFLPVFPRVFLRALPPPLVSLTLAIALAAIGGQTSAGAAVAGASSLKMAPIDDSTVELRSGPVTLARIALATPALRRGSPQLREVEVNGHRIAELRIPVRGRPAEEVWVADISGKSPRIIWTGLTGSRDVDDEAQIAVEVTPDRIFEYQTAAHVSRCDGEPVRLFTRAWDFGSGKFRPILSTPPDPAPAAQRLTARRNDPAMPTGRPIGGFHFTSASTTGAAGTDARALSAPAGLDDGDPKTVWAEGLGGDGRGEFLTARASAGRYRVRGIRIVPGDASSTAAFRSKNRIKSLSLAFGPEADRRYDVEFAEDPAAGKGNGVEAAPYWIALPAAVDAGCVTVIVREVYRGSEVRSPGGGGTTAISDLEVFTELDDASGVQRLVTDMAAGAGCSSHVPLLVALGEKAVLPAAGAIIGVNAARAKGNGPGQQQGQAQRGGRECLVEALARIDATTKSDVALDALATALVGATANEERLIGEVMRKAQKDTGRVSVPLIAALLSSKQGGQTGKTGKLNEAGHAAPADRARAARLLGTLDSPEATAALLEATGG